MNKRFTLIFLLLALLALSPLSQAQPDNIRTGGIRSSPRDVPGSGLPVTTIRAGNMETIGIWHEKGGYYDNVICSASTCGTNSMAGPRGGSYWAWFGGTSTKNKQFIEQPFYIPQTADVTLVFYYWVGAYSADSKPKFKLQIDGNTVWTAPIRGTTPGYSYVTVDLTPFADGQLHTLRFKYQQGDGGNNTVNLDDVEFYKGNSVLLSNPGFESEMYEPNWVVTNGTSEERVCNTLTKTYSYLGSCAFQFKGGAGENSILRKNFIMPTVSDTSRAPSFYQIYYGAMVKASPSATGRMKIIITFNNGTKMKKSTSLAGTGAYTWKQTPPVRYPFDQQVQMIEMIIKNTSVNGKIFVDDAELVQSTDY